MDKIRKVDMTNMEEGETAVLKFDVPKSFDYGVCSFENVDMVEFRMRHHSTEKYNFVVIAIYSDEKVVGRVFPGCMVFTIRELESCAFVH